MGLFEADWIKREVLRINRLLDLLHTLNLIVITKEDLIKFRGGGYQQKIRFGQEGHDRIAVLISQGKPFLTSRIGAVELSCLRFYLEKRGAKDKGYSRKIRQTRSEERCV